MIINKLGPKLSFLCHKMSLPPQSAFELYGADFMMTEDMSPWLIEINSSPSMARTTRATAHMVDRVLEDTLKGKYFSRFSTT